MVESFQNRYGRMDRWLHKLAFRCGAAQLGLADIEERIFATELRGVQLGPPVFITGLPRSGTTVLLEVLSELSEFAAHRYRDMPFLLCPLLWNRLCGGMVRADAPRERAHGDGLSVSIETPEALEEILWKQFWPRQYAADRVLPWQEIDDPEFESFIRSHMRKIALIRAGSESAGQRVRYLSKNNLNIARLVPLAQLFGDAAVVVPFRDPLQHAASLLRQHRRFSQMHVADPFARDYMADLGHYEFGENLRPVDFGGWLDARRYRSPDELGFWLEYWIEAYRALLPALDGERILALDFDALCAAPQAHLDHLAVRLELRGRAALAEAASRIRPPTAHITDLPDASSVDTARSLHRELQQRALAARPISAAWSTRIQSG